MDAKVWYMDIMDSEFVKKYAFLFPNIIFTDYSDIEWNNHKYKYKLFWRICNSIFNNKK